MAKSTKKRAARKPYDGFPLTAHPTGRWCKKCKPPGADSTKTYYFGSTAGWPKKTAESEAAWKAAIAKYNREWPFIIEGRTPPVEAGSTDDVCTLRTLCNQFLESKRNKLAADDLTELSYRDYYRSCQRMIDHFGLHQRVDDLRPVDFEAFRAKLAERLGVTSLLNEINRCRVVLKYASDQRLIPQPVNFGQSFDRPSKKVRRRIRNAAAPRMFAQVELRMILDALDGQVIPVEGEDDPVTLRADPQMKAMVLLGLNGGLGNTDVSNLHESRIDFSTGWLDYPRIKTETPRRIPLWPETVEALQCVLANRRRPRDPADEGIVFLTRTRQRWIRTKRGETREQDLHLNALSQAFGKLLKKLKIDGRNGLNFYTLRRQFEIVAGESRDQVAVDAIMGHCDDSMAAIYRQGVVSDDRLRDVVDHVRRWLWPDAT